MIGDEFVQAVEILNPGQAPALGKADIWQSGAGEFDEEGTLVSTWTGTFPPGTVLEPLADVLVDGRHLWVSGVPEPRSDLLTGLPDHVEAPLKSTTRMPVAIDVVRDGAKTRNALGDLVDTPTTIASAVSGSIIERRQEIPTADGDLRTLSLWIGWLPIDTDVREKDRLKTADGGIYTVDRIWHPITLGWREKRLELTAQKPVAVPGRTP